MSPSFSTSSASTPVSSRTSRCAAAAGDSLPKGHPDGEESAADAALREVREETGVDATLVEKLGDIRYWYMRGGRRIAKVVSFFLLDYVSGELEDHDQEVEHAEWMGLDEAARQLTYKGERDMAAAALSRRGKPQ